MRGSKKHRDELSWAHSLFTPSTTIYIVYWYTKHPGPIVYSTRLIIIKAHRRRSLRHGGYSRRGGARYNNFELVKLTHHHGLKEGVVRFCRRFQTVEEAVNVLKKLGDSNVPFFTFKKLHLVAPPSPLRRGQRPGRVAIRRAGSAVGSFFLHTYRAVYSHLVHN